jgi:hypothetical protein
MKRDVTRRESKCMAECILNAKKDVLFELSDDSKHIAIYYRDQKKNTIYLFDIKGNITEEAFKETFENIENDRHCKYYKVKDGTIMDSFYIREENHWILLMNKKQIEVISYEGRCKCE